MPKGIDPEFAAAAAEAKQELLASLERAEARIAERARREERRKARLRRWSFGLLGR
jgi:hypothetical protein